MVMSLRTSVSIAASFIIGIAFIATFSTDALARAAGVTRIDPNHVHHGNRIHHSGQAHRKMPARTPAGTTTGMGAGKP
jgi:hypothetical protein